MSKFANLVPEYAVAPQLTPEDFEAACAEGFKAIINLRPDQEKPGYLDAVDAEALAREHGLAYAHIPVPVSGPTEEMIAKFVEALGTLPGPILAHCGTGRRAAVLWAITAASNQGVDKILSCCMGAGHDFSALRPLLEQRVASGS